MIRDGKICAHAAAPPLVSDPSRAPRASTEAISSRFSPATSGRYRRQRPASSHSWGGKWRAGKAGWRPTLYRRPPSSRLSTQGDGRATRRAPARGRLQAQLWYEDVSGMTSSYPLIAEVVPVDCLPQSAGARTCGSHAPRQRTYAVPFDWHRGAFPHWANLASPFKISTLKAAIARFPSEAATCWALPS